MDLAGIITIVLVIAIVCAAIRLFLLLRKGKVLRKERDEELERLEDLSEDIRHRSEANAEDAAEIQDTLDRLTWANHVAESVRRAIRGKEQQ